MEAFSLSCRWDRVNSIVQGSFVGNSAGLSSKLSENEGQQNSDILQCMADYLKAFATVTGARGGSTASTEESNIVLSSAKGSVEILRSLGSIARAGDSTTLSLLMKVVILPLWKPVLEPMLSSYESSGGPPLTSFTDKNSSAKSV